ncbi:MAG: tetratricopeptide repeat protein [Bacteroidia bacterium]|nr:tetratricopeptide repeat protein [Bacteroidia bacterium]
MKKFICLLFLPTLMLGQNLSVEVGHLFQKKLFSKAEHVLQDYMNINPNDINAIELLGDAYGHQRKWDKAISQYKQLVERDNTNANFHYKYGGALGMKALSISKIRALGLIGDIKEAFTNAVLLDHEHIDARWALVEFYMQLPGIVGGSKKKSLKYAEELEDLSKVDGYLAKGYIYEYDNEPELAEKYYKLAIKEGGSITCFNKLTNLYENQNEPEKAVNNLENAYVKHNKNALHYQIGKVCADYNIELEKGERCLMRYIENYSARDGVPVEWAYYRLAQIYKNKNDKEKALSWINKALNIRSDFNQAKKEKVEILAL